MSINSQPDSANREGVPSQYDSMPLRDFFNIKTDSKIRDAVTMIMDYISKFMPNQDHGKVFDSVSPQDAIRVKALVNEYIKLGPLGVREGVMDARKKIENRIYHILLASYSKKKESLNDQYGSVKVALKFIEEPNLDLITRMNTALDSVGLGFGVCFSTTEFLDALGLEKRKKLSDLYDDLRTTENRDAQEEKIKTIITLFDQWSR